MACGCAKRREKWLKRKADLQAKGAARRAAMLGAAVATFDTAGKVLGVKGEADEQQK